MAYACTTEREQVDGELSDVQSIGFLEANDVAAALAMIKEQLAYQIRFIASVSLPYAANIYIYIYCGSPAGQ